MQEIVMKYNMALKLLPGIPKSMIPHLGISRGVIHPVTFELRNICRSSCKVPVTVVGF
jgi:hypothetical protein